jgi:uncharacterized integral membrane protein
MMKLLYVIVIVLAIFVGLTFTYMNNQMVELKYLSYSKEVNLPLLLICTLLLGVLAGYFASIMSSLKVRRNLSKVKKDLKNLKSSSI